MQVRRIVASMAAAVMVAGGLSVAAAPGASAVSAPLGTPTSVGTGDAAARAKVPVSVTVANGGRMLIVTVDWHDGLDARPGRDRFTVRVMAGTRELERRTRWDSRPGVETITVRLTKGEAKAFAKARDAGDAVVAVTQQSDTNADTDRLFERGHATVVRIADHAASFYRDAGSGTRDCAAVSHAPDADLSDCDLAGADLRSANLSGADLSEADLTGADLAGADLTGADLAGADLTGVNVTGTTTSVGGALLLGVEVVVINATDTAVTVVVPPGLKQTLAANGGKSEGLESGALEFSAGGTAVFFSASNPAFGKPYVTFNGEQIALSEGQSRNVEWGNHKFTIKRNTDTVYKEFQITINS